ncbi:phage conserved hypothetical protein BR0599 [Salinihabitans flavidus]|uniref:Bacteriophage phiJL001 Gp84 C-terminal domain-containing protein n=1 Tax=Salinihabitans flavidus TaxID=569882 RepID=A0A1H8QA05_9RHOB|nr:DUF2163 domain-containing protein [Salinihabitans flavidus]SEO50831.1 phage conserved hypothetical protein BR0599 [Salinihabitans flavidus]
MAFHDGLKAHLATGTTHVARCWKITRTDGIAFGFTDHDRNLSFGGVTFKADTGLSAVALEQSTGLSVDNTEALGALSDAAVSEADIEAGRFDGAEVEAWLVNWAEIEERTFLFRGTIGEIRRAGGAFQAELRGLTEALNRPLGRIFQKPCTAVLGDAACGFDLDSPGYAAIRAVEAVEDQRVFRWLSFSGFEPGWFTRGRLSVQSGAASGLTGIVKRDWFDERGRVIELWAPLRATVQPGDMIRIDAGCDKRFETCRLKFNNLVNYQGFPDLPGDDWLMAHPVRDGTATGGSRR